MKKVQLVEYPHLPGFFIKYENGKVVSSTCDKNGKDLYFSLPNGYKGERIGILDLIK